MAKANPFRFSTKYQDDETDLLYYGYRYFKDGRWISRDALADDSVSRLDGTVRRNRPVARGGQAFANIYAFVLNRPIEMSDYLGLDINTPPVVASSAVANCPCKCGPSVDSYIAATLVNTTQAFLAASVNDQRKACDNLEYKNYVAAIDAWDMTGIQSGVPPVIQSTLCKPCNNRLTFRGGCYAPEDLNYMMYGHLASLCEQELGRKWSASSVQSRIENVKNARSMPIGCSVAFALAGYDGRAVSCPSGDWGSICRPSSKKHMGNPTSWIWEPIRSRRDP